MILQKVLNYGSILFSILYLLTYNINETLTLINVSLPYSITSNDDKLVRRMSLYSFYLRLACYDLLGVW